MLTVQLFSEESLEFQNRIARRSGLGDGLTAMPPSLFFDPPLTTMQLAREEAEMVMFPCVAEVLKKTGVWLRKPSGNRPSKNIEVSLGQNSAECRVRAEKCPSCSVQSSSQ